MIKNHLSSSDESENEEEIFGYFDSEAALIARKETLPKKSTDRYLLVYETYKNWRKENEDSLSEEEENNLIVYFKQMGKTLKPTTLWSVWSMLKKTLYAHENIDIGQFLKLKNLLKTNAKGYKPKKSLVLKWNEIENFLNDADDYSFLGAKVILVFGICGALTCNELTHLKTDDVEDTGSKFIVSVKETKTDRQFIIGPLFYNTVKKYIGLKPADILTDRFFLHYCKGKCNRQVIGKNKIGETPETIASYLQLEKPKLYTGHCFRRSAATLLSDSGGNMQMIKQLGGCVSDPLAQGYSYVGHSYEKQNFSTKEPFQLRIIKEEFSESPSKRRRHAEDESGPSVSPVPSLNEQNEIENNTSSILDKNPCVKFENCTFNNCTFTIVSCACKDNKTQS